MRSAIKSAEFSCDTKWSITSSGLITAVLPKTVTAAASRRRALKVTTPELRET